MKSIRETYRNRRILITGHTGFKGAWLSLWLSQLGANVAGYSAYLPSTPCCFEVLGLESRIVHHVGDVRDLDHILRVFRDFKPEIVFHLAAQSLVYASYDDPKRTFDTNVGGIVNVLECIRKTPDVTAAVMITSDKCYRNNEWTWGYRENDRLGGDDPYSASKACAELVCHAYATSFFTTHPSAPRVATARAGNVIGGGDFSENRIIPDCVKAVSENKKNTIRHPDAVRPWQHVFEPLSGYLWLGAYLAAGEYHGEAFNFGPEHATDHTVEDLVSAFLAHWNISNWYGQANEKKKKENIMLKLCCDKARRFLNWRPALSFSETISMTAEWYKAFFLNPDHMTDFSIAQLNRYVSRAIDRNIIWAKTDDS